MAEYERWFPWRYLDFCKMAYYRRQTRGLPEPAWIACREDEMFQNIHNIMDAIATRIAL